MVDPVQRLKDMDVEGIDAAVLFGTSPFLSLPFVEDKDLASAIARVYNNWLAGYCKADPRRLKGVALTAIQDPIEAVNELRRAVEELKFVAVAAPPISASKKNLDDPDLYPFFAEAERLNVPVCIHVGAGDGVPAGTERFDHPFYTHAMAHPFEQMIAVLVCRRRRASGAFPAPQSRLHGGGRRLGALLDGAPRRALMNFSNRRCPG